MILCSNATERLRITSAGILQMDNGNQITAADTTTYLGLGGGIQLPMVQISSSMEHLMHLMLVRSYLELVQQKDFV